MQKINLEIFLSLCLIGLSILAYFTIGLAEDSASSFLLKQERQMGGVDYQTLPRLCAIFLSSLSCLNILYLIASKRRLKKLNSRIIKEKTDNRERKIIIVRTCITLIALVFFAFALPRVPFFILTFLFSFTLFWVYGQKNIVKNLVVAIAIASLFYLIFVQIAQLPL